jgi:20S proteasome subunit alpha 6
MVMNAPRGPSHMRRERQESQRQRSAKEQSPSKRDKKDKKKEKEKDNAKTTLTDFRIVGIEMKELGWSWGLVGEEAMNQVEEEEKVLEDEAKVAGDGDIKTEEAGQEEVPAEPTTTEEVKEETNGAEAEAESEVKAEVEGQVDSTEVKDDPSTEQADAPKEESSTTEPEDSEGKGKTGGKRKAQSPETGKLFNPSWISELMNRRRIIKETINLPPNPR